MKTHRIACTVAPQSWFGGRDYLGGKALTDALSELGHELFFLETECFYQKDRTRIDESLRRLREFAPEFALSTPNAGYGLGARVDLNNQPANVFTQLLQIPLALCWDDPLGQLSGAFLGQLAASPEQSEPGALKKWRAGMSDPLLVHCGWDSGHVQSVADLGVLPARRAVCQALPAQVAYLNCGKRNAPAASFKHEVSFIGNVYLNQITADPLHQISEIAALAERIAQRKLDNLAASTWELLTDELQRMPKADRARLKLSPDETFFWQAYRYIVWVAVNTRVRMGVLSGVASPVAFYGAFADPQGVSRFREFPNIQYQGSVDYLGELPAVFHQTRITVDVTNQLAQRSAPGKFFECFAAGGFMLLDRRPDLIKLFGEAAEKISYRTLAELNAKIDYFRTHEKERAELARHFQEIIRRDHTPQAWLTRIVEAAHAHASRKSTLRKTGSHRAPAAKENFLANALWNQGQTLASAKPQTRSLHDALRAHMPKGHPGDLPFHEWGQLMACALEFQPDVILELGRGYGNSTLAFTQAANLLPAHSCRVLSVCRTPWTEIRNAIAPTVTPEWFAPLTVHEMDLRAFDYEVALLNARRVLVFWDAHGYDVAECVLGKLLPILSSKQHLVLLHDMDDARYEDRGKSYGDFGLWQGEEIWPGPKVRLGNILATVPQAVSVVDFTSRNNIPLHTVAHSLHNEATVNAATTSEIQKLLGDDFFQLRSGCAWFTLNASTGPYHFPRYENQPAVEPVASVPAPVASTSEVVRASAETDPAEVLNEQRTRIGRMLGRSGPVTEEELLVATNFLNELLNAEDLVGHLAQRRAEMPEALVPLLCQHLQNSWAEENDALAEALEFVYGQCAAA